MPLGDPAQPWYPSAFDSVVRIFKQVQNQFTVKDRRDEHTPHSPQ